MLISSDSKYLITIDKFKIKVKSITSGAIVYTLVFKSKLVEFICFNPINKYQLLSLHSGGELCLWDYEDGILLKSFTTKLAIQEIFCSVSNETLYALVKTNERSEGDTVAKSALYKLEFDKESGDLKKDLVADNLEIRSNVICKGANDKFMVFVQNKKHIVVLDLKKNKLKEFKAKAEIKCLAVHPNEDCFATGSASGKIILWYDFLTNKNPTKSILHWHALEVLSLCFTTEGSYLLSGGHECVLVKWMPKTGQKDFKPRLGAPINHICCAKDNTIYALQHSDKTIHIIGANMNILQTFNNFTKPCLVQNNTKDFFPTGLHYFGHLNCLVTNSKPGHLQFFQPNDEKLLFHLDIIEENYISPENLQRPRYHSVIEHLEFNSNYNWLATVEARNDFLTTPEIKLKFWNYDTANSKFSLNTLVRLPHSYDRVTKIKFHPNENYLISCGEDSYFKTWALFQSSSGNDLKNASNWLYDTCNLYRNMTANDVAFSKRASSQSAQPVAISFQSIVTLWDFDNSMEFISELVHPDNTDNIKKIEFFDIKEVSLLIALHEKSLNVWDVDKGVCLWSKKESINIILRNLCDNSTLLGFIVDDNSSNSKSKKADNDSLKQVKVVKISPLDKCIEELAQIQIPIDNLQNAICLKKLESEIFIESNGTPTYLNNTDVFYCDSNQDLQKMNFSSEQDKKNDSVTFSMTTMNQNLPENSILKFIDKHKSQKFVDTSLKINQLNDAGFKKINQTPAYLLPKVSLFGIDSLRQMLEPLNSASNRTDEKASEDEAMDASESVVESQTEITSNAKELLEMKNILKLTISDLNNFKLDDLKLKIFK